MRKRGQVSFFIVIGVFLVVLVGFFIYLSSFAVEKKTKAEVITTQQMPTEIQEINNYVVGCLQKVTQDGLELIGKRGGMITKDEGGRYNPTKKGRDYVCVSGEEDYVCGSEGEMVNYAIINIVVGEFVNLQGVNILPKIKIGTGNIHENLRGYIQNALTDLTYNGCLDSDELNNIFNPKGFDIVSGSSMINIELDIADDSVKINLKNYPLIITNRRTGEERKLGDFYVTEKIRLRKTHKFLEILIPKITNGEVNLADADGKTAPQLDIDDFSDFEITKVSQEEVIRGDLTFIDDII